MISFFLHLRSFLYLRKDGQVKESHQSQPVHQGTQESDQEAVLSEAHQSQRGKKESSKAAVLNIF